MISAFYTLKDEEEFLQRSLDSVVPFVEQVILVDTASTDKTAEICKRAAACHPHVQYHRFEDDYEQSGEYKFLHFALDLCNQPWVLQMEGDAVLEDDWRQEFNALPSRDEFDLIAFEFFEHIGSYEYLHKGLDQKIVFKLFQNRGQLEFQHGRGAYQSHCSMITSAGKRRGLLRSAFFHYSYVKSNIVAKMKRNAIRGDWAQDPAAIEAIAASLREERDALMRLPAVELVSYYSGRVPASMCDLYYNTYRLDLDENGKILARHRL